MARHFIYAAATQLEPWRKAGRIPNQLTSSYFSAVAQRDVVWVIQRLDRNNADVLARFEVTGVTRLGRKVTIESAETIAVKALSMKSSRLRAEFVSKTGNLAGFVACSRGGKIDTDTPGWERGFRTGWELTPQVAKQFEAAWAEAVGATPHTPSSADSSRPTEEVRPFNAGAVVADAERVKREINARRGQAKFREQLLRVYDSRCVVTGCTAAAALEAAHIIPFCGSTTDHIANGLLLRSDIHTLFDLNLIRIHPSKRTVVIAKSLKGTEYAKLAGRALHKPSDRNHQPDAAALRQRWLIGTAIVET